MESRGGGGGEWIVKSSLRRKQLIVGRVMRDEKVPRAGMEKR